jgi:hypothetical protein
MSLNKTDRYAVYRNLNNGMLSVQSRGRKDYGKVIGHVRSIALKDVSFVVRPAGRSKVLKEGVKNVHAFAVGHLLFNFGALTGTYPKHLRLKDPDAEVYYNPYEVSTFVDRDTKKAVHTARRVVLTCYRIQVKY